MTFLPEAPGGWGPNSSQC